MRSDNQDKLIKEAISQLLVKHVLKSNETNKSRLFKLWFEYTSDSLIKYVLLENINLFEKE